MPKTIKIYLNLLQLPVCVANRRLFFPDTVYIPLSFFLFHVFITYHLVHGLSASLPLKFGTPYLFTLRIHNHPSALRRHLKTHYFQLAYPATYHPFINTPWFCSVRLWRFITQLLTYLFICKHTDMHGNNCRNRRIFWDAALTYLKNSEKFSCLIVRVKLLREIKINICW